MAITASDARSNLFGIIEQVNLDHAEVEITSKRGSAVLMSKADYDALIETAYLLKSPENAQRLLRSLVAAQRGEILTPELPL
jgi:antitoxin YefM